MFTGLIVFFLVSIGVSFLCSVLEAVLLSIPPSFVEIKAQEGSRTGKQLKHYKEEIDIPLSAILTLNTIAHTVGAIGVGAEATRIWGASIYATLLVPVAMTLAILILSEIIPKTIGASYWKTLSGFTVRTLRVIIFVLYPLVWVSKQITKTLKRDQGHSIFSRSDFSAMADIGLREGVFRASESRIIQNLLRFDKILTKDIMTPRTVVVAANETTTINDFYKKDRQLRFSRIPIFQDQKDHVKGFILKDELLSAMLEGKGSQAVSTLCRPIIAVKAFQPLPQLFNTLMEKREHIALVLDDFGGMAGIVSMEDVFETLLGLEIVDETDPTTDMRVLARKNWEKRAQNLGLLSDNLDP